MDDARIPDEDLPLPGGPPQPPVIPAPRRPPAQSAGGPVAPLVEDPFAAQTPPADVSEEASPEIAPDTADAPETAAAEPVPVSDAVAEAVQEAVRESEPALFPEATAEAAIEPAMQVEDMPVTVAEETPAVAEGEAVTVHEPPAAIEDAEVPAESGDQGAEPEPETEPTAADSLDDMVAGLREDESDQVAVETEPAEGEAAVAEGEVSESGEGELAAAAESTEAEAEAVEAPRAYRRRSARVPFYVYLGVWLAFAGVQSYLMWPLATAPFVEQPVYGLLVLVAVGLVCAGLVLGLCVWWYVSAHSEPGERGGLVRAMLMRTAVSMAAGALIWWVALLVLDLRRTGMLG